MKNKIFLLIAFVAVITACKKVGTGPDNNKAIDGVRGAIGGKWKALFLVSGADRDTIPAPAGSGVQFNFGSTDSAYTIVNDSILARSAVTWESNKDLVPGLIVVVMDASPVLPKLAVQGVFQDSLFLITPDADRTEYVFKR